MKKYRKQAQAALEFLMTYGWALLVVLVAIGALAFFGVLNPGQFLPDQCVFFPGVTCTYIYASMSNNLQDEIQVTIQNGLGYTMTNFRLHMFIGTNNIRGVTFGISTNCKPNSYLNNFIENGDSKQCGYSPFQDPQKIEYVEGDISSGTFDIYWDDPFGNNHLREGSFSVTYSA
jgi:hypothetical protein